MIRRHSESTEPRLAMEGEIMIKRLDRYSLQELHRKHDGEKTTIPRLQHTQTQMAVEDDGSVYFCCCCSRFIRVCFQRSDSAAL